MPKLAEALDKVENYLDDPHLTKRFDVFVKLMDISKDIALVETTDEAVEEECWNELIALVSSTRKIIRSLIEILFRPPNVPFLQHAEVATSRSDSLAFIKNTLNFMNDLKGESENKQSRCVLETRETEGMEKHTEAVKRIFSDYIDELFVLNDKKGLFEFLTFVEEILRQNGECDVLNWQQHYDLLMKEFHYFDYSSAKDCHDEQIVMLSG